MNFYIVMQGRTFEEERAHGVICSEIFNKKGEIPHFWGRMTEVVSGDVIFHYVKGEFVAISIATSNCYEDFIPYRYNEVGFIVKTEYVELPYAINVKAHFDAISPLLPVKYSPFQDNADGNQGYIFPCNEMLALKLLELTSDLNMYVEEDEQLELAMGEVVNEEQDNLGELLSYAMQETDAKVRHTHSKFTQALVEKWACQCAVCGLDVPELLRATYAKPWKDSTETERIDAMNGLLLCANHSALYTSGLIAFDGTGAIHISPELDEANYGQLFIYDKLKVHREEAHKPFYKWHKKWVFRK